MDFDATHTYERVRERCLRRSHRLRLCREKYEALGHGDVELNTRDEDAAGGLTLVTSRVVPLELSGFATKVLSPRQSVTETDPRSCRHTAYTVSDHCLCTAPAIGV